MMRLMRCHNWSAMPLFRALSVFGFFIVLALAIISLFRSAPIATSPNTENVVVASVGGYQITLSELEQAAALSLYQVDQQRHATLRKALQDLIDEELLMREATRKGVTVAQLLEDASRSTDIARLANLPGPVKRLSLNTAQSNHGASDDLQEEARIRQALLVSLRRQANIRITLPDQAPPIVSASSDDDPFIGPSDAPITIIEFSDFQCPYCKTSVPVIKEILAQYGDKVRVVYRDYPGPNHPYATQAAEAAQCAGDQGKFWDYHDLLFSRQMVSSGWDFAGLGSELKLDSRAFATCLETGRYREEVMKDLRDGLKLGISSTPTFFVNGRPLIGARPFADFKALIDSLLAYQPSRL